jgi:hypothetical protein
MTAAALPMAGERRHVWNQASQQFMPVAPETGVRPAGFIKGPLPLDWMQRAARLPGKTLQVALALWYLAGLQKSLTVKLASKPLDAMGVSRDAKYDALARLAAAGLVAVDQKPGQAPIVTLRTASA